MKEGEAGDIESEDDVLSKKVPLNIDTLKKCLFQQNNVAETFYTMLNKLKILLRKKLSTSMQKTKFWYFYK